MAGSVVNTHIHIHIHILNGRLEGGERAVDAAALARIRSPSERERENVSYQDGDFRSGWRAECLALVPVVV